MKLALNKELLVKLLGSILVVIAFVFLGARLWANRSFFLDLPLEKSLLVVLTGGCLYGASCFLLSYAWMKLLHFSGEFKAEFKLCYTIYARTQIAKYIPGNIFQFAGRHIAGRRAGFKDGPMVAAALYEIAGLLFISAIIALFGISRLGSGGLLSPWSISAVIIGIFLLPLLFSTKLVSTKLKIPQKPFFVLLRGLLPVYFFHLFFCICAGLILFATVAQIAGIENMKMDYLGTIIPVFSISFIAGFLAPGAPAGLGVREAIMVVFLSGLIGESASLAVSLGFRLTTILGDMLFFISSLGVKDHVENDNFVNSER